MKRWMWIAFMTTITVAAGTGIGVAQNTHHTPKPASGTQAAPPATSYVLIDKALAASEITTEQAYTYRVFAAFGDTRLPARFRGADGDLQEPPSVVTDAARLGEHISGDTRALLAPFFRRPASPGSWLTLSTVRQPAADGHTPPDASGSAPDAAAEGDAPNAASTDRASAVQPPLEESTESQDDAWFTVRAAGGKAKIWAQRRYAGDSLKAEQLARELTGTIWPRLVGLFWAPLDDADLYDNGGGPEFDIYLVRVDFSPSNEAFLRREFGTTSAWRGFTQYAAGRSCGESQRYLLIDSRYPVGGARSVGMAQIVAHELMHAIAVAKPLRSTDCTVYQWINEATATWAEDWTYPQAQSEQRRAIWFLRDPRTSLGEPSSDPNDLRYYGSYLFPFYLANNGKQQALPEMWSKFATLDVLPGIDGALRLAGTTLEETFPRFALANWNRPSVDDYKQGDNLQDGAEYKSNSYKVSVPAGTSYEKKIFTRVHPLAATYAFFELDNTVKTVTFENTIRPIPFATVWGIEKIKGTWQKPIDFSKSGDKTWCRENAAEDLEALVIIVTNNQWQNKELEVSGGPNDPVVRAARNGCAGWSGTSTITTTITSSDPAMTVVETVNANMRFVLDSSYLLAGQPAEYWKVTSGQVDWEVNVSGQCSGRTKGNLPITDLGPGNELAVLRVWDDNGTLRYDAGNGPWPIDVPTYQVTCPNNPPGMGMLMTMTTLMMGDDNRVKEDGKSISAKFNRTVPASSGSIRYDVSYTLRRP